MTSLPESGGLCPGHSLFLLVQDPLLDSQPSLGEAWGQQLQGAPGAGV